MCAIYHENIVIQKKEYVSSHELNTIKITRYLKIQQKVCRYPNHKSPRKTYEGSTEDEVSDSCDLQFV